MTAHRPVAAEPRDPVPESVPDVSDVPADPLRRRRSSSVINPVAPVSPEPEEPEPVIPVPVASEPAVPDVPEASVAPVALAPPVPIVPPLMVLPVPLDVPVDAGLSELMVLPCIVRSEVVDEVELPCANVAALAPSNEMNTAIGSFFMLPPNSLTD